MITVEQIKAARAMLNLSQKELALKAGIAVATLNNLERRAQTDPKLSTITAIQETLESEGIEFINDSLSRIGLFLKPKRNSLNDATILIVDDSKSDRALYKKWLKVTPGKNYHIVEAESARDGFDSFMECHPDCVILDFMMYGADGFQLLTALKREPAKLPPIIFVTGMHNDILEESARSQGVHAYLNKQKMSKEELHDAVENALRA